MNEISSKICNWYEQNKRDLPWRHTRDPYHIWLSETILQQTRVAQGWDYYQRFVQHYPTVQDLAEASEDDVLKLWQGLGYYSRARNLLIAARQVMEMTPEGERPVFPNQYSQVIQLKGVGPYTAAAVASISANENVAVVDGNVYRVLSRLFDLPSPIDTSKGQKEFLQLATELLPIKDSGRHNQAMMELGALCCTPTSPACPSCPVAEHCLALANGTIMQRPVKSGKITVRDRFLTYIIYIYNNTLWVHQRGAGDIWQGLWEPYLEERPQKENVLPYSAPFSDCAETELILQKKHQLTHQTLHADFWVCRLTTEEQVKQLDSSLAMKGYKNISWTDWQGLAVPKLIEEANRRLSEGWF